jgi:glycine betaine/choline ABC-type transport system substrate-binding protein
MLVSGQTKKEAIIKDDINSLIQIMNQESRMMKRIAALEEERIAACQAFLREKGIKSSLNLNITELSRLVFDPEEKQSLLQTQASLSKTLNELKLINDLNQKLIEQSLNFINYSVDLLGASPMQEITYAPPTHKPTGSKASGFFDTRA